jgi:hypothetical protein
MSLYFAYLKGDCPICNGARKDCRKNKISEAIHCREVNANPSGYKSVGEDRHGFLIWKIDNGEEQSAEEIESIRQRRAISEAERRAKDEARYQSTLSLVDRDREFRKLFAQLSLSNLDKKELLSRGLTEEQIERGGFKSVETWQRLRTPLDLKVPGIQKDGRSLFIKPGDEGYIYPIFNEDNLIVGYQLRRRTKDGTGRYRWPTSAAESRPWGQSAHLQNGQLPIAVCRPDVVQDATAIGLTEGTGVKPFLTSQRFGQVVLGASGGSFSSSDKWFKLALDKLSAELKTKLLILYPDSNSTNDLQVFRKYQGIHKLVRSWGYTLRVAWWGQLEKTDPDIDEISADTKIEIITFAQYERIGNEEKNVIAELSSFIQNTYNKAAWKFWKRTGSLPSQPVLKIVEQPAPTSAIVLYRPEFISYEQGNLISHEEWLKIGQPKIQFQGGDRLHLLKEIYLKWGKIHVKESSRTGQGKSHDAGNLTSSFLAHEVEGVTIEPRVFYNDVNHRNPSTATVERNFADHPTKNNGFKTDSSRKTPSGYSHVKRPRDGEAADLEGNCPETSTFFLLSREKDLGVSGGKGSPICENCSLFKDSAGKIACEYLTKKHQVLNQNKNIRQHIDQSVPGKEGDVSIVEEVGRISPVKSVTASKKDIAHAYQELKVKNSKVAIALEPIYETIYSLLELGEIPLYGIDGREILQKLPSLEQLQARVWAVWEDEWLSADNVWDVPSLSDLPGLVKTALIPDLYALISANHTPWEKQEIIRNNIPLNWIGKVLEAITANSHYLSIDATGLRISRYNHRYRKLLNSFKMTVLMDSTCSKEELTRKFRLKKSNVLEIEQQKPDCSNLTVRVIKGLGTCSKQRRDEEGMFNEQTRIEKVIEQVGLQHQGDAIAITDHQHYAVNYRDQFSWAKSGYWGNDNRGSNEFQECTIQIEIGKPIPNLLSLASEWHCLTGELVSPTKWSGRYGQWVRSFINSEAIQNKGRLRSHLKPGQHVIYVLGHDDIDQSAISSHFPGATIEEIDVYNFCPEAAPKGVQRERALMDVLFKYLQRGENPTTSELGEELQVNRSRISQLVKEVLAPLGIIRGGFRYLKELLTLLIESLKTKLTVTESLPEDAQWIAQTYFPLLLAEDDTKNETPHQVVSEVVSVLESFGRKRFSQIAAVTNPTILSHFVDRILANIGYQLLEAS